MAEKKEPDTELPKTERQGGYLFMVFGLGVVFIIVALIIPSYNLIIIVVGMLLVLISGIGFCIIWTRDIRHYPK